MSYFDPYILAKMRKISYFDPYFSSKLGKMYSFDRLFFFTLVAFLVDGRWGTSLSQTWPSTPPGHCAREALPHAFTQQTHDAITSLWRQNDGTTSFWRHDNVVIASCVCWVNIGMSKCSKGNPTTMKHIYNESENLYESCDVAFHSNDWWNLP